jgi:hypothetical protein
VAISDFPLNAKFSRQVADKQSAPSFFDELWFSGFLCDLRRCC